MKNDSIEIPRQKTHGKKGSSSSTVHVMKGSPVRQSSRKKSKEVDDSNLRQQQVKGEMAVYTLLQKHNTGMARVVKQ